MSNQEVPRIKTTISESEVVQAFLEAAKELYQIELTKPQLSLLIAQNNLETGNRKAMFNYNIGNIMHTNQDSYDYFLNKDKTRAKDGKWVPFTAKFRAYPSLKEGAKDYIRNLHNRANGSVWQTILQADPVAFSKALKKSKYYEADEKDYTAGIVNQMNQFNKGKSFEDALTGNFSTSKPSASSNDLTKINEMLDKFLTSI